MITNINNKKNSINFSIWKHIYFQSAKSEGRPGQNQSVGVVPTQRQALPIRRQDTCSEQVLVQSPTTLMPAERTSCYHMHNSQESF